MRAIPLVTPLWRHARYIRKVARRPLNDRPFDLQGSRVLITGASNGIGRALALEMVAAGAQVVSVDVSSPDDEVDAIDTIIGDVRTYDFSTLLPFDLVVANAGVVDSSPTGELDDDALERLIGINFTGLVRTLNAPKAEHARALVISSRSAVRAEPRGIAYGATKAAGLNYAFTFATRFPTTVAIVGITETKLFEAEAAYHGRPAPGMAPDMSDPRAVARRIVAAVEDGLECVVTDKDTLRDVASYSHWLASAAFPADLGGRRPR